MNASNPSHSYFAREKRKAWIFFSLFLVLIGVGIFFKRILGHSEMLVPFHVAALFPLGGWFRRLFVTI